jgi:hypothetical protein
MKKNIKKIKTRQKQKQRQSVNVKIHIDQSKKSINKPTSKTNKPPPYTPIPPIMINPATQTSSNVGPFSFSEIKDVVRNVLGESINNKQPTVQFVGEEMRNPYDMKTPQQNTSSKLYDSIPNTGSTFGYNTQSKVYPFDNWIDVDTEKESIRQQNESLSAIFKNAPNEQTLSTLLNTQDFETPPEMSLSSNRISPTEMTLSRKEKRKQQLNQNYLDRKQKQAESPFIPLDLNKRTQQQLLDQADELGIDTHNENKKGKGSKKLKTRQQLIEEITQKLKTPQTTFLTPTSEIMQYSSV